MYKKILLLLALTSIINAQKGKVTIEAEAQFVDPTLVSETEKDGSIVRRYKVAEKRLTEQEILDELECFEEATNCYFKKFDKQRWVDQVENVVTNYMEEGERYEAYFVMQENKEKYQFQFLFWRIKDTIYGILSKRNRRTNPLEGSNVAANPAFEETLRFYRPLKDGTCFKMIPKGCKYSGQSSEYFQELCIGYDEIAEKLRTDILKVSAVINTKNSGILDTAEGDNNIEVTTTLEDGGVMNPALVARDIATCLSRTVRNNTIQLDCAVKGIPMDHTWAIERLNTIKGELEAKGMLNVVVDVDALTLNYDQDLGVTDSKKIKVKGKDFKA